MKVNAYKIYFDKQHFFDTFVPTSEKFISFNRNLTWIPSWLDYNFLIDFLTYLILKIFNSLLAV